MKFADVCDDGTRGAFCRCSVAALVILALAIGVITAEAEETGPPRIAGSSAANASNERTPQSSLERDSGTRGAKGFLKGNWKVPAPKDGQGGCAETVKNIPLFEGPDAKAPRNGTAGICGDSGSYVLRIDEVRGRKAEFKDQDLWCIDQNEICNPRWYEQRNSYILIKASGEWAWVRAREIADYFVAQTWAQEFTEADTIQLKNWQGYQVHEKPSAASKSLLTLHLQEGKHVIRRFTGRQSGSWLEAEVWELPEGGREEYLNSYELDRLPIYRTSVKHTGWIKVLTDRGEPGWQNIPYSGK